MENKPAMKWFLNVWMTCSAAFSGADVAARVGNPHFLPECNPLGVGNIHYKGHAAEVQGYGCSTYFECFGRRF